MKKSDLEKLDGMVIHDVVIIAINNHFKLSAMVATLFGEPFVIRSKDFTIGFDTAEKIKKELLK